MLNNFAKYASNVYDNNLVVYWQYLLQQLQAIYIIGAGRGSGT